MESSQDRYLGQTVADLVLHDITNFVDNLLEGLALDYHVYVCNCVSVLLG